MKKYRYHIIFLIITLLMGGSLFATYWLKSKVVTELDEQQRLALEEEVKEKQIQDLPHLQETFEQVRRDEGHLDILYTEGRVVEVVRHIESLAKEEGITVAIEQKTNFSDLKQDVKKSSSSDKKSTEKDQGDDKKEEKKAETLVSRLPYEKSLHLAITAKGSYQGIRTLISKLETAPYALDIIALDGSFLPDEEKISSDVSVSGSSNPFLLQAVGTASSEGAARKKLSTSGQVSMLLDIALYIQP
jgi:hypothetical protein